MKINQVIVQPAWLKQNLTDKHLIILDASLRKDKTGKYVEQKTLGIPGARYFNISDVFSDQDNYYPNMLVNYIIFEREARKLGINNKSKLVIYDTKGVYSSPRAWWMFKLMGHHNVFVLDGGLPGWEKLGYDVHSIHTNNIILGDFKANPNMNMVWDYAKIKENLKTNTHLVIDARSSDRFLGTRPEPRTQTKSGHIKNSINLHYNLLLKNGFLKSEEEIIPIFNALKIGEKPLVFSCGSGITACILYLSAYIYLNKKIAVYDGSWAEWGEYKD